MVGLSELAVLAVPLLILVVAAVVMVALTRTGPR